MQGDHIRHSSARLLTCPMPTAPHPLDLVAPDARYAGSFRAALAEFHAEGRNLDVSLDGVPAHISELRLAAVFPGPGQVPETTYWGVSGGEFLGRVGLRHTLTEGLLEWGGHIGYEVRPSARGRGVGHALLAGVLPHARALGLARVLLTCDDDNLASARIIERGGGVLEDLRPTPDGPPKRRYWIELQPEVKQP